MERCDQDLAFMLQYENVAWYENGKVRILDRRIYPTEVKFVECTTYKEVAQAITDMVTQSAGPYTAAGMGMALAAHEVEGKTEEEQIKFLTQASYDISHARPTIYPSFDIVPPHLISGVVTDKGVYVPYLLNDYFKGEVKDFY